MLKSSVTRLLAGAVVLAAWCAVTPVQAGVDIDFGANVRVGDSTDVYFAISSRYFGRDREVVASWGHRYDNPDDLAVALFVSKNSGRSPDFIFALRRQGFSWWEIGMRVGVSAEAWFLPVNGDPGPPYGKAYGHWKKHKSNPKTVIVLADTDARNLVAVRVIHEYYGVPVKVAMQWRASGRDLGSLVSDEYHRRHGKRGSASRSHGDEPDRKGHGKGHGKKHGKGRR